MSFELAVHSMDIAKAAQIEDGVPDEVITQAAALAASIAAAIGHGRSLLLALTGRSELPRALSILEPNDAVRRNS